MNQAMILELKRLKKKRKFEVEDFDMITAAFWFAGNLNQNIPTEFGREAFSIVLNKLQK